ncbi:hypothetical protein GGI00_000296 [Coemansia sp. RSA 2681]|nr:hypothetical protein GGI00_000296 [Coemansia sp. RSA 2681]
MRFSLTLAASACLLALSNATTIGFSGSSSKYYTTNDYYCHNISTMDHARLQVLVSGGPAEAAMFYSGSNCKNYVKTAYDIGGPWQSITGPIRSYRLVAPYNPTTATYAH